MGYEYEIADVLASLFGGPHLAILIAWKLGPVHPDIYCSSYVCTDTVDPDDPDVHAPLDSASREVSQCPVPHTMDRV